jgi:hypothetical protein
MAGEADVTMPERIGVHCYKRYNAVKPRPNTDVTRPAQHDGVGSKAARYRTKELRNPFIYTNNNRFHFLTRIISQ